MALSPDLQKSLIKFAAAQEGGPRRWHITRLCMYRTLSGKLAADDGAGKDCLCISGSHGLARHLGLRQATVQNAGYPEVNLLDLPYPDASFDQVHGAPSDFWRFTPQALALLGTAAGAETVLAGGWGNRAALAVIELGFRMLPIPEHPANPLFQIAMRNEPDFPIVTWVILRKPAARRG